MCGHEIVHSNLQRTQFVAVDPVETLPGAAPVWPSPVHAVSYLPESRVELAVAVLAALERE